jgi:tetratricopeptide (TPR) repeat protein
VPVQWVTAPHAPTLERLESSLRDGAGAVLVGVAGVGKTELARAAAERFPPHQPSRWITGTAPLRAIPFGAFSHLIDVGAGTTAAVLRAARAALSADQLLTVDDAHRLDKLSASLVYQLAVSGSPQLVVTVDPAQPAPTAISALWADGLLPRIDVEPLDGPATTVLLAAVTGGRIDPATTDAIYRAGGGNPLYLRRLVGDGRQLDDSTPAPALPALIEEFLATLPPAAHLVLEYLAVDDPLSLTDVCALTGADAVERAHALGAVTVTGDGLVRPAHPLYTDTVRAALGPAELRRLCTVLLARLPTPAADDVVARLRLAALALDSDTRAPVAAVVIAAEEALRLGDLELSERLGRSAVQRTGGLAARLPLAYALAWQGRGRDSDAVLAPVETADLSEPELLAWALPRAANQFWMLSEPERATAFLQTTRSRLTSPVALHTIDALAATFAMNAGSPQRAMTIATEVLASPAADDTAVGWAASAAALSCARMGRFDEVDALAERALAAGHPGLLRFTSGFGQTTTLVMAGELDSAQALAQRLTDFAELQQPGRAIGEVLVAQVLITRGDFAAAVTLLRGAAAALAPTGYSWGPLALMYLAQALGQQGDTAEAAKALSRAESRHGMKSALFGPELGLARAWTLAAPSRSAGDIQHPRRSAGDILNSDAAHRSIAAARDAARTAQRGGQSAIALRALHDAVRLGETRAADEIARLTGEVDCVVGRLAHEHSRALAAGDGAALQTVAADFAALGMNAAAADAAAQAAGARCATQP